MARNVSPVVVNQSGVPFRARIVFKGDSYGLDHCLTHNEAEPSIEFYDARYASTPSKYTKRVSEHWDPEGQFVSRYYMSTFLGTDRWSRGQKLTETGLDLQGDEPDWKLSAENVREITAWANKCVAAHRAGSSTGGKKRHATPKKKANVIAEVNALLRR